MAAQELVAAQTQANNRGEVIRYTEDRRAAIVAVAEAAREAGKTWAETVEEAHKAGYKGCWQNLRRFLLNARKRRKGAPVSGTNLSYRI